jgi:glycosyltransferase involved in cell wall biosynthesis
MRLLYLHYGPQSGVTASTCGALSRAGAEVLQCDVVEPFMYQLRPGSRCPNPRPDVVRAVAEALRAHGRRWKPYYLHTTYAFDRLTALADEAIRISRPDVVLQAGVLFGPGHDRTVPYHLYVDHTRALAERFEPLPGLPRPIPFERRWREREEAVFRGAASVLTMSEHAARSLRQDYEVDPARIRVVGAGPNVEPGPADLGLQREPAILFVGRNFVPKGGPELLQAFAAVRREHPSARLWIVSSSAPPVLPDGAEFRGVLGRDALARLYATASVFVLPTLREAFGLSFVEAMSFALPVVATRVGAIPEIVAEGETALLVPRRDPAALAGAICELLADPARARRMGAQGRARALARFGWARAAEAMLDAIRAPALPAARRA